MPSFDAKVKVGFDGYMHLLMISMSMDTRKILFFCNIKWILRFLLNCAILFVLIFRLLSRTRLKLFSCGYVRSHLKWVIDIEKQSQF